MKPRGLAGFAEFAGERNRHLRAFGRPSWRAATAAVSLAVLVALSIYIVINQPGSGPSPFTSQAWLRFWDMLERFSGSHLPDGATPAYLQASFWNTTVRQCLETLEMSLLAAVIAGGGIILAVLVSANPRSRATTRAKPRATTRGSARTLAQTLTRALFVLTRSIPEYIWALVAVLVAGPGAFAGALALGIHNFGVLGRLANGTVSAKLSSGTTSADTAQASQLALAATGASSPQLLLYGALPSYAPELLTFFLYRWEVIIRTSIVVGFITNAGLGLSLRLALSYRFFTELAGIILAYVVLVLAVDLIAAGLRQLAKRG